MENQYPPIGFIRGDFTQKFGVPRQSLMVADARAVLKLNPDPLYRAALNHLESFSHVWIIFVFHQHLESGWMSTIRPPRIDAPNRVGVFASRSPHRPNPIGISAVKLDRIDFESSGGIEIHLSGVDLMDGTPVLDIKPYLPFADSIPEANGGWAHDPIPQYKVEFLPECLSEIEQYEKENHPGFRNLLTQILQWDPRPTSQRRAMPIEAEENQGKTFFFRLLDFDVQWVIQDRAIQVNKLISLK